MEFDKNSLLKLGKLSKIKIDDDKLSSLSKDLGSILNFIDRLQSIDTEEVDPTSNSLDQSLFMRDDIAIDKNSANEILENAPENEIAYVELGKLQFDIASLLNHELLNIFDGPPTVLGKVHKLNDLFSLTKD